MAKLVRAFGVYNQELSKKLPSDMFQLIKTLEEKLCRYNMGIYIRIGINDHRKRCVICNKIFTAHRTTEITCKDKECMTARKRQRDRRNKLIYRS
jgi:hypothetical protein